MFYTDQYKAIVAECQKELSLAPQRSSFTEIADEIGYKFPTLSKTTRQVTDELDRQIKDSLTDQQSQLSESDFVNSIINQFQIEHSINRTNANNDGYEELSHIKDILSKQKCQPLTNKAAWKTAFKNAFYYKKLSELGFNPQTSRNLRIIECVRFFKRQKWAYKLEDGQLYLVNNNNFLDLFDKLINDIGIKNVLSWLFTKIEFDSYTQMFTIVRETDVKPSNESQIPYGFLLSRALYLANENNLHDKKTNKEKLSLLEKTSKHFTRYLDVLPYNPFETTITKAISLDVLNRWIRYDWLVDFLQYPCSIMDSFIHFLSSNTELNNFANCNFGYSLKQYYDAIQDIQDITSDTNPSFIKINAQEISSIPKDAAKKILSDLSVSINDVNKDFSSDQNITSIDYYFKPLFKIKDDQYLILPQPLMCIGFYEAIADKYRKGNFTSCSNDKFDSFLGTCIEDFIANKCKQFALKDKTSNFLANEEYEISNADKVFFNISSQHGECDFILETTKKIYFIESKKKNLCRATYNGDVISAYTDLTKSLFASQEQALRHELLLKRNNTLVFESQKQLNLNGKDVVRISITTFDFKSLQQQIFARNLLTYSLNKKIITNTTLSPSNVTKINKSFNLITNLVSKGIDNEYLLQRNPFFNTCWLNLFQLIFILNNSKDSTLLAQSIENLLHLSYNKHNLWADLSIQLNQQIPSPAPFCAFVNDKTDRQPIIDKLTGKS